MKMPTTSLILSEAFRRFMPRIMDMKADPLTRLLQLEYFTSTTFNKHEYPSRSNPGLPLRIVMLPCSGLLSFRLMTQYTVQTTDARAASTATP